MSIMMVVTVMVKGIRLTERSSCTDDRVRSFPSFLRSLLVIYYCATFSRFVIVVVRSNVIYRMKMFQWYRETKLYSRHRRLFVVQLDSIERSRKYRLIEFYRPRVARSHAWSNDEYGVRWSLDPQRFAFVLPIQRISRFPVIRAKHNVR